MGSLTARRQRLRFLTDLGKAAHETAAFSAIGGRLDPFLNRRRAPKNAHAFAGSMLPVMSRIELPEAGITKDDIYGMVAIFWIDLASVIPAVIPFLIFLRAALRSSGFECLLIASLFGAGFMWGKYTGINAIWRDAAQCCSVWR